MSLTIALQHLEAAHAENARLGEENARLRAEVERLRADVDTARDMLAAGAHRDLVRDRLDDALARGDGAS